MLKVRLGACLFQPTPPDHPGSPRITQKVRAEAEQEAARTRASAQAKVEQLQRAFAKVKPTKSQRSHNEVTTKSRRSHNEVTTKPRGVRINRLVPWCCVRVPLES